MDWGGTCPLKRMKGQCFKCSRLRSLYARLLLFRNQLHYCCRFTKHHDGIKQATSACPASQKRTKERWCPDCKDWTPDTGHRVSFSELSPSGRTNNAHRLSKGPAPIVLRGAKNVQDIQDIQNMAEGRLIAGDWLLRHCATSITSPWSTSAVDGPSSEPPFLGKLKKVVLLNTLNAFAILWRVAYWLNKLPDVLCIRLWQHVLVENLLEFGQGFFVAVPTRCKWLNFRS